MYFYKTIVNTVVDWIIVLKGNFWNYFFQDEHFQTLSPTTLSYAAILKLL